MVRVKGAGEVGRFNTLALIITALRAYLAQSFFYFVI
jgi:hypothetical protein